MTEPALSMAPLQPPPGGRERLRIAVERRAPRRIDAPRLAIAASLAAVGVIALSLYAHRAPQREFERELRAAMAGLPQAQILESGVVRDLPSTRSDVRIIVAAPATQDAPAPR